MVFRHATGTTNEFSARMVDIYVRKQFVGVGDMVIIAHGVVLHP